MDSNRLFEYAPLNEFDELRTRLEREDATSGEVSGTASAAGGEANGAASDESWSVASAAEFAANAGTNPTQAHTRPIDSDVRSDYGSDEASIETPTEDIGNTEDSGSSNFDGPPTFDFEEPQAVGLDESRANGFEDPQAMSFEERFSDRIEFADDVEVSADEHPPEAKQNIQYEFDSDFESAMEGDELEDELTTDFEPEVSGGYEVIEPISALDTHYDTQAQPIQTETAQLKSESTSTQNRGFTSHAQPNERKETPMASSTFTFDEQSNDTAKIKVVGIGGGGGNAINNMIEKGLSSVEYVALNTDAQALKANKADVKIQIGSSLTQGLGAGARPEIGREAVEENRHEIEDAIEGADMVFITAGMGGGTGTGGAPIVAGIARKKGILTVGIVTTPFDCEGKVRMKYALEGINELRNSCDTLIVIPNERLLDLADDNTSLKESFAMANEVLYNATRGISDLIIVYGVMNVDFADVRTTMINGGAAVMGAASAVGPERAEIAAHEAINSPLLDGLSIRGARNVLVNISAGSSLGMKEMNTATNIIRGEAGPSVEVILGTVIDDSYGDELRITVIATGFDFVENSTQIRVRENNHDAGQTDPRSAAAGFGYNGLPGSSATSSRPSAVSGTPNTHPMSATGTSGLIVAQGRELDPSSSTTGNGSSRDQNGFRVSPISDNNRLSQNGSYSQAVRNGSNGVPMHNNPAQLNTPLEMDSKDFYKGEQNLRNLDLPAIHRRPLKYTSVQGMADEDSSSFDATPLKRDSPVFDEPDETTTPARPIRTAMSDFTSKPAANQGYVERQRIDKSEPDQPAFLRRIMD